VPALVREEIPFGFSSWDFHLIESDQFKCCSGKVRWILMISSLVGFGSRILVPLLAGNLTSSACCAFCCIYEK
jgi:hypothetical protein